MYLICVISAVSTPKDTILSMNRMGKNPAKLSRGDRDNSTGGGLRILARIIARTYAVRHLAPTRPEKDDPKSVGSDMRDKDREGADES